MIPYEFTYIPIEMLVLSIDIYCIYKTFVNKKTLVFGASVK